MTTDLIVLGAGPAGIAVSLLMARRGYSVEILDPARFPREKICGEFLNPQAVQWLEEQDLLEPLLQLHPFPILGMKITDAHGRSFTGRYSTERARQGYAVLRRSFDHLLVSQARTAGICIREGWKANRLIFDGGQVCGVSGSDADGNRFEKHSRLVIGADGRNNLIGRTFGWVRGIRHLRKYAFQTYFENLPDLSHFGEMHMVHGGYLGIAPLTPNLANVALVVDEKVHPGGDVDAAAFLQERIRESPLAARFAGLDPHGPVQSAGPLAFTVARTSGHGTLLVGDTCGFIDPFTGEGINYAFLGASLAAPVLDRALQSNHLDDATLSEYDRARRPVFSRKFTLSRLLQRAIGSEKLATYLIRKFADRLDLADIIVSAVGAAVPINRVWNLRFVLKVMAG